MVTSENNFSIHPESGANRSQRIDNNKLITSTNEMIQSCYSSSKEDSLVRSTGTTPGLARASVRDLAQFSKSLLNAKYTFLEAERLISAAERSLPLPFDIGSADPPPPSLHLGTWDVYIPTWHPEPIWCLSSRSVIHAIPDAQYWQSRRWSCYCDVFGVLPVVALDQRVANAAKDRLLCLRSSLFADSFTDCFQSWTVTFRYIREYPYDRRAVLKAVRRLDKRRTKVLSSLWQAEHPPVLPPPPSTTVHHSYIFDFKVRHWPGAVAEPSDMRTVTLWRLPFADALRELPAAHLWRSLRWKSYLGIFGVLPVDMLERSLVRSARAWCPDMQDTLFAQHFVDCNDSWRATLALIRSRPIGLLDKKTFKAVEAAREQALLNYYQSLPALSGSYFPALPPVGRVTHPNSRRPSQHHGGSRTHPGHAATPMVQQQRQRPSQHHGGSRTILSCVGHSPPPPCWRFPGLYDPRLVGRFVRLWKPSSGILASGLHYRPTKQRLRRHRTGTSRSGRGPPVITLRGVDPSILVAASRRCRSNRRAVRQSAQSQPARLGTGHLAGRPRRVAWNCSRHLLYVYRICVRGSTCMLCVVYVYDSGVEASVYLGLAAAGLPYGRCGIG